MNINATLFAQFVVFFILAGFTMKFVWPPLMKALDERAKKIADGLAAADKGQAELRAIEKRVTEEMQSARAQVQIRLQDAEKRAQAMIEEAKSSAALEAERIIANAQAEANLQISKARDALRQEVANLAVEGARKILQKEINATAHADLLNQLKGRLAS